MVKEFDGICLLMLVLVVVGFMFLLSLMKGSVVVVGDW